MKAFLLNLLYQTIRFLQTQYQKATRAANAETQPYHSLSPTDTVGESQYSEALLWALANRKGQDIKNIALTGPYGSGKSSILRSFQLQYKYHFHFLNISLATFKEEVNEIKKGSKAKATRDESKDLLRLIELSILQQIFYHEKDSEIPDSRFKKIRSFKKMHLLFIASSIIFLCLCGFNLFANEQFYKFFNLTLPPDNVILVRYYSLVLFVVGLFFVIYRSIRLLSGIKVSKLKFQDTEIEIDKGISRSILNNHLDEILYFFEVTKYDIVVIEDLDRFEQTEIFTKLRELNLLINNSKKIKKDVTFIYAVRDDMFQDKDRTKFFDFIIPVIPVINSSNSNNKLLEIVRANDYDISEDLVDDIGLFVDDMRLLYNITNEYYLYRGLLDAKLTQDKLLGMIVYKNIFPNDFAKLSNREGDLYGVFANKQSHVVVLQKQLDQEIEELKTEIKRLGAVRIKDILDLRRLYLLHYPKRLKYFNGFYSLDKNYSLDEAAEDKPFQLITEKKMNYHNFVLQYGNTFVSSNALVEVDFSTIEAEVDSNKSYADHLEDIEQINNNQLAALRLQIQEKERKKASARHLKIKDLIATGAVKIETDDKKKSLLVNVLMRAGHIDEEYLDYISIFYEGAITKDDRDFLLNVKSQVATDFDFELYHLDKLVPKINMSDFEQSYTLNYKLLDFILNDNKYDAQLNATFQLLKQADGNSLAFIDGFIATAQHVGQFIQKLAAAWPQLWHVISNQAAYTDEHKFKYLDLIISFAKPEDIEKLALNSDLKKTLLNRSTLLSDISDPNMLKPIITTLKLVFGDVELADAPQQLVDFIYENNYYTICPLMFRRVMQVRGTYEEDSFNKANFYAIQSSGATALIAHVEANLNEYVAGVYLQLEQNTQEPEGSLLDLLNKSSLSEEDRTAIIAQTTSRVTYLSQSSFTEVDAQLLSALRVEPLWENVVNNFISNDNMLTDAIIVFLNHLPNAEALSEGTLTTNSPPSEEEATVIDALIKKAEIDDRAFELLTKAIPMIADKPDFTEINENHAEILIENNLVILSPENFDSLKNNYSNLHIRLAESQAAFFVATIADYTLSTDDLAELLLSTDFNVAQKQVILDSADEDVVIADIPLLNVSGQLALRDTAFSLSKNILLAILTTTLTTPERVKLFNMNYSRLDKADVTAVLEHLPQPYSDIAVKGRRPLLDHSQENHYIANNLKTLGYISKRDDEKKGIRISTFKK